jgi:hypothetical protein
MTDYQRILSEAHQRGIAVRLDDAGNLKISGDYSDRFLSWAKDHKAALVAELRKDDLDAFLDEARAGTCWTQQHARDLFSPLDLQLIRTGELSLAAAQHFLREHQSRNTCRQCLSRGCKQCDYYGRIHVPEEQP